MKLNFLTKKGFTLIELLIVVAIIAILAAIAIPNFLQAQIRAKVSNVKEGMQASATALEAYYVDNNSYPWELPGINQYGSTFSIPNSITTPIAYMTSIPTDVFDLDVAIAGGQFPLKWGVAGPTRGLVVNEADGNPNTDKIYVHREDNQTGVQYVLFSEGPGEAIALAENGSAIAGDGYFWYNNGDLYGYSEICQPYRYWYNPTNGTVSLGYVARLQGGTNSP